MGVKIVLSGEAKADNYVNEIVATTLKCKCCDTELHPIESDTLCMECVDMQCDKWMQHD